MGYGIMKPNRTLPFALHYIDIFDMFGKIEVFVKGLSVM